MTLNNRTKLAGERAARNLSDKAYAVYIGTDPMEIFCGDELYAVRSALGDLTAVSFDELERFLEEVSE